MQIYTGEFGNVTDASFCHRVNDARSTANRTRWSDQANFCRRRAYWVVERNDAKRSLNGTFAISTIHADHDDSDDAIDLDMYLLRRRRNIETNLRYALENQKLDMELDHIVRIAY